MLDLDYFNSGKEKTIVINYKYVTIGIIGFLTIITEIIHTDITAHLQLWLVIKIVECNSDFWKKIDENLLKELCINLP